MRKVVIYIYKTLYKTLYRLYTNEKASRKSLISSIPSDSRYNHYLAGAVSADALVFWHSTVVRTRDGLSPDIGKMRSSEYRVEKIDRAV